MARWIEHQGPLGIDPHEKIYEIDLEKDGTLIDDANSLFNNCHQILISKKDLDDIYYFIENDYSLRIKVKGSTRQNFNLVMLYVSSITSEPSVAYNTKASEPIKGWINFDSCSDVLDSNIEFSLSLSPVLGVAYFKS